MSKKWLVAITLLVFLVVPIAVNSADGGFLAFKSGVFFKWRVELKGFERALGGKQKTGFETYWLGELYFGIKSVNKHSDNAYEVTYDYSMNYINVIRNRYTNKDTSDRVREGLGENISNGKLRLGVGDYDYRFGNLTWGFKFYFLVTPLVFFNTHHQDFKDWLTKTYLTQQIGAFKRVSGLIYESWDITLGTKRDVYYVEVFLIAAKYDLGEPVSQTGSVVEYDFTIDREYGFISNMRIFWEYSQDVSFEIRLNLVDTNAIPKNRFYYMLFGVVVILIVILAIFKYYQKKKYMKLIRI